MRRGAEQRCAGGEKAGEGSRALSGPPPCLFRFLFPVPRPPAFYPVTLAHLGARGESPGALDERGGQWASSGAAVPAGCLTARLRSLFGGAAAAQCLRKVTEKRCTRALHLRRRRWCCGAAPPWPPPCSSHNCRQAMALCCRAVKLLLALLALLAAWPSTAAAAGNRALLQCSAAASSTASSESASASASAVADAVAKACTGALSAQAATQAAVDATAAVGRGHWRAFCWHVPCALWLEQVPLKCVVIASCCAAAGDQHNACPPSPPPPPPAGGGERRRQNVCRCSVQRAGMHRLRQRQRHRRVRVVGTNKGWAARQPSTAPTTARAYLTCTLPGALTHLLLLQLALSPPPRPLPSQRRLRGRAAPTPLRRAKRCRRRCRPPLQRQPRAVGVLLALALALLLPLLLPLPLPLPWQAGRRLLALLTPGCSRLQGLRFWGWRRDRRVQRRQTGSGECGPLGVA